MSSCFFVCVFQDWRKLARSAQEGVVPGFGKQATTLLHTCLQGWAEPIHDVTVSLKCRKVTVKRCWGAVSFGFIPKKKKNVFCFSLNNFFLGVGLSGMMGRPFILRRKCVPASDSFCSTESMRWPPLLKQPCSLFTFSRIEFYKIYKIITLYYLHLILFR